jgi:hypothetical protein
MASPFDALDAELQSHVAEEFGEAVRVEPRVAKQYAGRSPGVDPSRPVRDVRAVVTSVPAATDFRGEIGGQQNSAAQLVGATTEAWLDADAASSLGYDVATGDTLVRLDEPGLPRFRVQRPVPYETGDLRLLLSPAGSAA